MIFISPIVAAAIFVLAFGDVLLWTKNTAMPKRVRMIFITARMYWVIFYAALALGFITDPLINLVFSRISIIIVLISESVVMAAYLLSERHDKPTKPD